MTRVDGARTGRGPDPGEGSTRQLRPHPGPLLPRLRQASSAGLAGLLTALLGAYHLLLLWQRVADLSLFQPAVALRWLLSAVLLGGLLWLHRKGEPLVRSRRALILWLLVLLLHVCFLGPLADGASAGPTANRQDARVELALVLPAALLLPLLLALTVAGLVGSGYRLPRMPEIRSSAHQRGAVATRRPLFLALVLGRPPPLVPISVS